MLTTSIALGVAGIIGGFVFGRASADTIVREARTDRDLAFRDSIEAWAETARAVTEAEHWKSIAASPVSALVAAARSARA